MTRLAADEDFHFAIVEGLRRQRPDLDLLSVHDAGLATASDPEILEWAAGEDRVLLTHDVSTMTAFAWDRVRRGLRMPGVLTISQSVPIGLAIEEILLDIDLSLEGEWENMVQFLPL